MTDPLVAFETKRFYEVEKYLALTNQMWGGYWFLINADAWGKLPKKLRDVVAKHADVAARLQRGDVERLEQSLPAKLQGRGMVVNTPKPEPFRQKLRDSGFYSHWKEAFGPAGWRALERYAGPIV